MAGIVSRVMNFASGSAYKAVQSTNTRPIPKTTVRHEDENLEGRDRRTMMATARDAERNFSLAAWTVRKHLDFVSSHYFVCNTQDKDFNRELEQFVAFLGMAPNFDISGRHDLRSATRLVEQSRVLDGDIFCMKMRSGHLQFIESDRLQTPALEKTAEGDNWYNGCLVNKFGRPKSWAVWQRNQSATGYTFERTVRARNMIQVGYFSRFDQIRGISPLASGLNMFRDCYDNLGYALAKSKVAQMFGLKFYRDSTQGIGEPVGSSSTDEDGDECLGRYDVSFGRGPVVLDLWRGDDAQWLENKTPPQEFQSFMQMTIGIAMKSLDIPYNFFDESYTNFFGSKAAFILYQKSTQVKQRELKQFLNKWFYWRMRLAIASGEFTLPSGVELEDIRFDWLPDGTAWWDPGKEIKADIEARNAGFKTLEEIIRQRSGSGSNGDWRAKIDQIAIENEYIKEAGISLPEILSAVAAEEVEKLPTEVEEDIEDEQSDELEDE